MGGDYERRVTPEEADAIEERHKGDDDVRDLVSALRYAWQEKAEMEERLTEMRQVLADEETRRP